MKKYELILESRDAILGEGEFDVISVGRFEDKQDLVNFVKSKYEIIRHQRANGQCVEHYDVRSRKTGLEIPYRFCVIPT